MPLVLMFKSNYVLSRSNPDPLNLIDIMQINDSDSYFVTSSGFFPGGGGLYGNLNHSLLQAIFPISVNLQYYFVEAAQAIIYNNISAHRMRLI